jgi:single-strand DNA-binding protein
MVEGRLRLDQWDDKQTGQKRSRLGVVAETVQFLGSPGGGGGGGGEGSESAAPRRSAPASGSASASAPAPSSSPESDMPSDDDVPF